MALVDNYNKTHLNQRLLILIKLTYKGHPMIARQNPETPGNSRAGRIRFRAAAQGPPSGRSARAAGRACCWLGSAASKSSTKSEPWPPEKLLEFGAFFFLGGFQGGDLFCFGFSSGDL